MTDTNYYDYMRVEDLKSILNKLPDEMLVVIPVVDEYDVNRIHSFRKVRTAGILRCEDENEDEREVLCLNGAANNLDISHQIRSHGSDVSVAEVLYGNFQHEEEGNK